MIITGCQRSGTKTVAHVLGLKHEATFSVQHGCGWALDWTFIKRNNLPLLREVSWLAQPFWPQLNNLNIKIIHLVRHPLDVISSIINIKFWESDLSRPYRLFAEHFLPGLMRIQKASSLIKSVYYYVYWNEPLHKFPRLRLEDIANIPILNQSGFKESVDFTTIEVELKAEGQDELLKKFVTMMDKYKYAYEPQVHRNSETHATNTTS